MDLYLYQYIEEMHKYLNIKITIAYPSHLIIIRVNNNNHHKQSLQIKHQYKISHQNLIRSVTLIERIKKKLQDGFLYKYKRKTYNCTWCAKKEWNFAYKLQQNLTRCEFSISKKVTRNLSKFCMIHMSYCCQISRT